MNKKKYKTEAERIAAKRKNWLKATKKYNKKNTEAVKKGDRDRKRKKYSENPQFSAMKREQSRMWSRFKRMLKHVDDAE